MLRRYMKDRRCGKQRPSLVASPSALNLMIERPFKMGLCGPPVCLLRISVEIEYRLVSAVRLFGSDCLVIPI
jgi:hypothetical protein